VAPKQTTRGHLGKKLGAAGAPPIDTAPKRDLYIHHTVTSNHRRARAEELQHMRDLEQVQRP
jgi:hypothetical protein